MSSDETCCVWGRPGDPCELHDDASARAREGPEEVAPLAPPHPADEPPRLPPAHEQPTRHQLEEVDPAEAYPPLDWEELWSSDADEIDWIVDGLVEAGRAASIFAPGKTGKSLVLLELSACIATGTPFAGLDVPKPRTVVYVDYENSPGDVLARLKSFGLGPNDLARLVYLSLPMLPPLDTDQGGRHLAQLVDHHQADLVVLDTVARAVEGAENDADTVRDYYRATGLRLKAAGVAAWRLDHSGKDLTRGQRGSSAKADDVDAVWKLTAHGHGRLALHLERRRTVHGIEELHLGRGSDGRLIASEPHAPTQAARIEEVITALDAADVPADWGRRRAARVLREANIAARNTIIDAAIEARRDRSAPRLEGVPDDVPRDPAGAHPGAHPDDVPAEPCPDPGARPGHAGARTTAVPAGGDVPHWPSPPRGTAGHTPPHPPDEPPFETPI